MSKSTISTFELFNLIPDAETARLYLESRLWPDGVTCPTCAGRERITTRKGGFYRCNRCETDFTVRTGTIFERSHVPLHKWVYAMYLVVTARKGISSMQLAKEIGVTQKTAWFMLQRLREACAGKLDKLAGFVEVDECFVGGLEKNKHEANKLRLGRGSVGKTAVLGLRQRGGKTIAFPIQNTDKETLQGAILEHVEIGSQVMTDEASGYQGMDGLFYYHATVNHGAGEYKRGGVHTNSIESVCAPETRRLWHLAPHQRQARWPLCERSYIPPECRERGPSHTRPLRFVHRRSGRTAVDLQEVDGMKNHRPLNMCAEVLGPAKCHREPLPGRQRCRVHEEPLLETSRLAQIADLVLAYRPKPKSKAAKKRKRKEKKHGSV